MKQADSPDRLRGALRTVVVFLVFLGIAFLVRVGLSLFADVLPVSDGHFLVYAVGCIAVFLAFRRMSLRAGNKVTEEETGPPDLPEEASNDAGRTRKSLAEVREAVRRRKERQ